MPINCPKCQAKAAVFKTGDQVEMNFCAGCRGLWFDRTELARKLDVPDPLELTGRLGAARATEYRCPRCAGESLVELPFAPGADLLVDVCRVCHGAFLDARELGRAQAITNATTPIGARLRQVRQWMSDNGYVPLGGPAAKQ